MHKNAFKEQDKEKLIAFLNHVAKHATWEHNTQQAIEFFKLLSYMQQVIVPKINDNILEVMAVKEAKPAEESKEEGGS